VVLFIVIRFPLFVVDEVDASTTVDAFVSPPLLWLLLLLAVVVEDAVDLPAAPFAAFLEPVVETPVVAVDDSIAIVFAAAAAAAEEEEEDWWRWESEASSNNFSFLLVATFF
jgi:hypothetical protein